MADRHCVPSGNANASPRPRARRRCVDDVSDHPPLSEKRPVTDDRPGRKTAARDSSLAVFRCCRNAR